jgi:tetratricopeptide (TPR) repeat protein
LFSDDRYSEAATLFEIIMAIQKKEESDVSYSILSILADLSRTYEKQGRISEARELELQMMELSKRVLATEYFDTLEIIRQNSVLQHRGKHEKAEIRHEQALEDRKKAFKPEHLDTLHYFSLLGLALDRQRNYEEAENLHRLAFGGFYKVLGPEHYNTLTGIFSLAFTLIAQDKKKDAFTLLEEFVELRSKSLGSDEIDTEDASYCRRHWEDYYRMRLLRRQQQEQKMIKHNEESQHMEDTPATTITARPNEQSSGNPAQRFIRDHPLLRASRGGQPVQEGHDLQEVD